MSNNVYLAEVRDMFSVPDEDGWYSNIGNITDVCLNTLVNENTLIHAMFRDGREIEDTADNFSDCWCEVDKSDCDIVKYRII